MTAAYKSVQYTLQYGNERQVVTLVTVGQWERDSGDVARRGGRRPYLEPPKT